MTIVVGNRRRGGGWWRLGLVLIAWLAIAAPTIAAVQVARRVRAIARSLPPPPDLAAWQAGAPRTSTLVAHDGTTSADSEQSRVYPLINLNVGWSF